MNITMTKDSSPTPEIPPLQLPFTVSDDIRDIFNELPIMGPNLSSITCLTSLKPESIHYLDEDRLRIGVLKKRLFATGADEKACQSVQSFRARWLTGGYSYLMNRGMRRVDNIFVDIVTENGYAGKPGKTLLKAIPGLPNKTLEKFAAHLLQGQEVAIIDDVTEAYKSDVSSCMSNKKMEWYEKNGVQVVVVMKYKKIVARALFWPKVYFKNMGKFLPLVDRQYDIDGRYIKYIEHFAKENGFVLRLGGISEYSRFKFEGKEISDTVEYTLLDYKTKFIPYPDTFLCGEKKGETVVLNNSKGTFYLRGNEGRNPFFTPMVFSKLYNMEIPENNATHLSYRDDWVLNSDLKQAIYKGHTINAWFEDVVACKACGNNHLKMDTNIFTSYDGYVCGRCSVILTAGEWIGWRVAKGDAIRLFNGTMAYKEDILVDTPRGKGILGFGGVCEHFYTTSYTKVAEQVELEMGKFPKGSWQTVKSIVECPVYYIDDSTRYLF